MAKVNLQTGENIDSKKYDCNCSPNAVTIITPLWDGEKVVCELCGCSWTVPDDDESE